MIRTIPGVGARGDGLKLMRACQQKNIQFKVVEIEKKKKLRVEIGTIICVCVGKRVCFKWAIRNIIYFIII